MNRESQPRRSPFTDSLVNMSSHATLESEPRIAIQRGILKETILRSAEATTISDISVWKIQHSSIASDCDGTLAFVARKGEGSETYRSLGAACLDCGETMPWGGIELTRGELSTIEERMTFQRETDRRLTSLARLSSTGKTE